MDLDTVRLQIQGCQLQLSRTFAQIPGDKFRDVRLQLALAEGSCIEALDALQVLASVKK